MCFWMSNGDWLALERASGLNVQYRNRNDVLAICRVSIGFAGHLNLEEVAILDPHLILQTHSVSAR